MKNNEIQVVRSTHVLGLFAVLGVVIFILAKFVSSPEKDLQTKARRKAESLAYQLVEIERGPKAQARGPASLTPDEGFGQIGKDPWGRPFNYIVSKKDNSIHLVVTSLGPNPQDKSDDISVNLDIN